MSEDKKDKDRKDDVDESASDTIEEKTVEAPREEKDSQEEDAAEEESTEDEEEEEKTEERKPLAKRPTKPPAPKKKAEEAGPLGIPQRDILPLVIALSGLLVMVFARYQTANLNLLYGGLGLVVIGVIAFVVTSLTR
ncbi:MAG: hypothetical protein QGG26_12935 [Candidatus Undinarchaeales archaeon]|jgi:hypothetical protein|nr:hypothetical protein [Candidatus Undinarchaeales archaeon]